MSLATWSVIPGDCRATLPRLPAASAQCCVTSPPYWGLRDYGTGGGQMGLEGTPAEYVAGMVKVFREVRRVLKDDGVLWLNLGDCYAGGGCGARDPVRWPKQSRNDHLPKHVKKTWLSGGAKTGMTARRARDAGPSGLKPKDLVGIPWRVAFALQADGWWLRSDIIWHKPNCMPESVLDRPTRAHEYIFLLTKSEQYRYDAAAIREPLLHGDHVRHQVDDLQSRVPGASPHKGLRRYAAGNKHRVISTEGVRAARGNHMGSGVPWEDTGKGRNKRSVWTVTTKPNGEAHFATFPEDLVLPCVLAGSRPGDLVLDPFNGSGTTGAVALKQGRDYVGLELNPEYVQMSRRRLADAAPLLSRESA